MAYELIKDIAIIIGIPVVRSVAGWGAKALEDNKITTFEWKQLFSTVVRVGTIGTVAYVGLNVSGIDVPALGAMAGAFFFDKLYNLLKRK